MLDKQVRGRKYIPHGYCNEDDTSWVPHCNAIDPVYTNFGPDWTSSIRYIPSPRSESKREILPRCRSYSNQLHGNYFVWYRDCPIPDKNTGKRCWFRNGHMSSKYGGDEISDRLRFGNRRKLNQIDTRNGFDDFRLGDKSYLSAEYSPGFFKDGVSVPVVPFGRPSKITHDTFIPIFPCKKGSDYNANRKEIVLKEDISDVKNLQFWTPAKPAMELLYDNCVPVKMK